MKLSIFTALHIFVFCCPQWANAQKNIVQSNPGAKSEEKAMDDYITDFLKRTSLRKEIEKSFESALIIYSDENNFKDYLVDKAKKTTFREGVLKFKNDKEIIVNSVISEVQSDLKERITLSEAKYLSEFSQYKIFSKLDTYLASPDFKQKVSYPFLKIQKYTVKAKTEKNEPTVDKK